MRDEWFAFKFTAVGIKAESNDTPEPPDAQNDQNNTTSVPKWCLCILLVLLIAGGVLVVVIVGANVKPRYWIPPEASRYNIHLLMCGSRKYYY